jgi:Protein of unknown function (DUF4238)
MTVLPRFNHSVPEFILCRFAIDGKVWIFDKHTKRSFPTSPKRAMGERDFPNVYVDDVIMSFEHKFSYVESLAAPIIAEILERKALDHLGPMDAATLNMFVVLQLMRSKARRIDQKAIVDEIRKWWPEAQINPYPERIEDSEFDKLSTLRIAFDNLESLTEALVFKHMFLMMRDCQDELYISDNPVVMHNSRTFGPYGNIGLAVPGIEIYYPLSPNLVLAYFCPSLMKQIEQEQVQAEKDITNFFAKRLLSSAGISQSDIAHLQRSRAEVRRSKNYYNLLNESRLVPMDGENIFFLNSLQMRASYRFVAASRPNFSFAKKVLSERPHWREGLRIQVG